MEKNVIVDYAAIKWLLFFNESGGLNLHNPLSTPPPSQVGCPFLFDNDELSALFRGDPRITTRKVTETMETETLLLENLSSIFDEEDAKTRILNFIFI